MMIVHPKAKGIIYLCAGTYTVLPAPYLGIIWHYCVHKDILRLQSDRGWSDIGVVTEHDKLMSDAYKDDIIW
ncbi:hypothetical protein [Acetobacter orientalis]|uniref:hypothetical protein n=1 Tax=Acetobacter orientalis TaxID=146474 RepID=UPI000A3850BC|nr:hypothetical protein [Acetobacter orientalis]